MGVFFHPNALGKTLLEVDKHLYIFSCYLFDGRSIGEHSHQLVGSRD